MNIAALRALPELEKDGVWIPYQGAEFRIASGRNDKYTRALRRKFDQLSPADRKKPAKTDPLLVEALAEHVLLEWRGEVKDGNADLAPTVENRRALLSIPQFREWVAEQALDVSNFQKEAQEEELSDLKSGS